MLPSALFYHSFFLAFGLQVAWFAQSSGDYDYICVSYALFFGSFQPQL